MLVFPRLASFETTSSTESKSKMEDSGSWETREVASFRYPKPWQENFDDKYLLAFLSDVIATHK